MSPTLAHVLSNPHREGLQQLFVTDSPDSKSTPGHVSSWSMPRGFPIF